MSTPAAPPPTSPARTRVRFRVLAFLVALAGVTYLDRVCIALILPRFADPMVALCIARGLYFRGAFCWSFVDPSRPILVGPKPDGPAGPGSLPPG